jgi:peptidoglycan hydrolase-like protein with peptidoglycan-binding domain
VDSPAPSAPAPAPTNPNPTTTNASRSKDPKDCDGIYKLNFGMKDNPCVAKLQKRLKESKTVNNISIDGDYGNQTRKAVATFIKNRCLETVAQDISGGTFEYGWWGTFENFEACKNRSAVTTPAASSQDRGPGGAYNPDVTTPVPNSQQLGPGGDYNPDDYKSSNELGMGGIGGSGNASPPPTLVTVSPGAIPVNQAVSAKFVTVPKDSPIAFKSGNHIHYKGTTYTFKAIDSRKNSPIYKWSLYLPPGFVCGRSIIVGNPDTKTAVALRKTVNDENQRSPAIGKCDTVGSTEKRIQFELLKRDSRP